MSPRFLAGWAIAWRSVSQYEDKRKIGHRSEPSGKESRRTWLGAIVFFTDAEARIAAQEEQLIAQIAAGNIEEPLKVLCRRYEKDLYRFGVQMLGDEGLAGEMVEESFRRLWRNAARYDSRRDSPGTFLFMIARSAAAGIRECRPSRAPLPPEDLQLPLLP